MKFKFFVYNNEKNSADKLLAYFQKHNFESNDWNIIGEYDVNQYSYINGYSFFKNDKLLCIESNYENPILDIFGLKSNYIPTEEELTLLKRTKIFNEKDASNPSFKKMLESSTFKELHWQKIQSPKELEYSKNMKAALYFYCHNLFISNLDSYNSSLQQLESSKSVKDLEDIVKSKIFYNDELKSKYEKEYKTFNKMFEYVLMQDEEVKREKEEINNIIRQIEQRVKEKKLVIHYDPTALVMAGILSADNKVLDGRKYIDYLNQIVEEAENEMEDNDNEEFSSDNVISHTKLLAQNYEQFIARRNTINWENFKKFFPKEMQFFWNGEPRRQFVGWKFTIGEDGKVSKIPVDCNHSTKNNIKLAKANEEINCCFEKQKDENGTWILDKKTGKPIPDFTKYHPLGIKNAYTWSTLDEVIAKAVELELDGIGFEAGCGIGTLDIDSCIDKNGNLSPLAKELMEAFDTFSTKSPSGTGLHLYFNFKPTELSSKFKVKTPELEAYLGRLNKDGTYYPPAHFFAEAGLELDGAKKKLQTLKKAQETVEKVLPKYLMPTEEELAKRENNLQAEELIKGSAGNSLGLTSEQIIEKLTQSYERRRNEFFGYNKFEEMYHFGNWEPFYTQEEIDNEGQSQADLTLCNMIAFYTDSFEQIDNIFRSSGLMREKWDRITSYKRGLTYGEKTIALAMNNTKNFKFNPNYNKNNPTTAKEESSNKDSGMEMD